MHRNNGNGRAAPGLRSRREARSRPLATALVLCGLALGVAAAQTPADPTEIEQLRAEAARLRQSLDAIDARIQALESKNRESALPNETNPPAAPAPQLAAPAASAAGGNGTQRPPPSPLVELKEHWSQVEAGTSSDKVLALLGKPDRELRINGKPVWYYVYPGIGRGSVFFNSDGRVSTSQSPSLGWSQ